MRRRRPRKQYRPPPRMRPRHTLNRRNHPRATAAQALRPRAPEAAAGKPGQQATLFGGFEAAAKDERLSEIRLSLGDVAGLFRVQPSTVTGWRNEGLPVEGGGRQGARGSVELGKLCEWIYANKINTRAASNERDWLTREQARKIARENAVADCELVWTGDVLRINSDLYSAIKQQLQAIGSRVANDVAAVDRAGECRYIINGEARRVLTSIATSMAEQSKSLGSDAQAEQYRLAATGEDAGPVGGQQQDTTADEGRAGALAH